MKRHVWIAIAFAFAGSGTIHAQTNPPRDIRALMNEMKDVRTIRPDTDDQILKLARKDPAARKYVGEKLPELIRSEPTSDAWLTAVRVAGQLKATETIPALMEALSRKPFPAEPNSTFGRSERLDIDIVAKALSQIGDPVIPSVVNLLGSTVKKTRGRAVIILWNIGSPASRKALQDQLQHETDPDLKKLIQESLHG